jgi:RNA polymerase sigma-70 factor, ECF subfamily
MFGSKQASFEAMVRAFSPDLYRFAFWLCRDRSTAEDLVQETFRRAWQHWPSLRDERAARAWLLTVLRREHARLYARAQPELIDPEDADVVSLSLEQVSSAVEMRDALGKLPQGYREALLLQVLFGFDAGEIARTVSSTEGAVLTRLSRARQALRRLLDPSPSAKPKVMP